MKANKINKYKVIKQAILKHISTAINCAFLAEFYIVVINIKRIAKLIV